MEKQSPSLIIDGLPRPLLKSNALARLQSWIRWTVTCHVMSWKSQNDTSSPPRTPVPVFLYRLTRYTGLKVVVFNLPKAQSGRVLHMLRTRACITLHSEYIFFNAHMFHMSLCLMWDIFGIFWESKCDKLRDGISFHLFPCLGEQV
jgi:hypothetical protein